MENSEILAVVFELKERIINGETYRNLKVKEAEMLEDKECFKLLNEYQDAQSKYNEAKRFEKYGSNVAFASKNLSDIKYKVDENKFVQEYNLAFKKMNKELKDIEKIIFKDLLKERKEIGIE